MQLFLLRYVKRSKLALSSLRVVIIMIRVTLRPRVKALTALANQGVESVNHVVESATLFSMLTSQTLLQNLTVLLRITEYFTLTQ